MMRDAYAHTNDPQVLDSDAQGRIRAHETSNDDAITHDSLVAMSEVTITVKNGESSSHLTFTSTDVGADLEKNDEDKSDDRPIWETFTNLMLGVENKNLTMQFEFPQNIRLTRTDHLKRTTTEERLDG